MKKQVWCDCCFFISVCFFLFLLLLGWRSREQERRTSHGRLLSFLLLPHPRFPHNAAADATRDRKRKRSGGESLEGMPVGSGGWKARKRRRRKWASVNLAQEESCKAGRRLVWWQIWKGRRGISWNPKKSFYRTGLVCFSKLYQQNEKVICVDLVDFICQKKTD